MNRTWLMLSVVAVSVLVSASVAFAQDKKPATPAPAPSAAATAPKAAPAAKPVVAPAAPAAAAAAATAPTTTPVPPPAAKPAPELDQLKFLLGKWKCDGRQFAGPFGPEHTFKATAESKADVDGFWNQFNYEEKKSKEHHGFKVHGLWGWDQGAKHLVRAAVSGDGGWDTAVSPGFEADKVVWTGDFSGPMGRMPFRHTFTKKSDKEWGHMLEVKDPTGKWSPMEDVACKR
jgi:Protein of unknown function (DUF1579)